MVFDNYDAGKTAVCKIMKKGFIDGVAEAVYPIANVTFIKKGYSH